MFRLLFCSLRTEGSIKTSARIAAHTHIHVCTYIVGPLPGIVLSCCCSCCCCCCAGCCCKINMLPFSTTYAAFQAWRILKGRVARSCRALPRLCTCVSLMTACLSEQGAVSVCVCVCWKLKSCSSLAGMQSANINNKMHPLTTYFKKGFIVLHACVCLALCVCVCVCVSLCTDWDAMMPKFCTQLAAVPTITTSKRLNSSSRCLSLFLWPSLSHTLCVKSENEQPPVWQATTDNNRQQRVVKKERGLCPLRTAASGIFGGTLCASFA